MCLYRFQRLQRILTRKKLHLNILFPFISFVFNLFFSVLSFLFSGIIFISKQIKKKYMVVFRKKKKLNRQLKSPVTVFVAIR